MTKRKDDCANGIEPKQVTRRETLKAGAGLLAIGCGIGVTSTEASALATQLELRFLGADGRPLDSIRLPAAVAEAIDAGDAEGIGFVWYVKKGDKKKLAEHAAPGRAEVAHHRAKPRNR